MKLKFSIILLAFVFVFGILFPKQVQAPKLSKQNLVKVSTKELVKQRDCLKEGLWFESRSEPFEAKKAVLSVIHNRVKAKGFPSTYCKVVQSPRAFSYRNNVSADEKVKIKAKSPLDKKALKEVEFLANSAALGSFKPTLEPSVLYYTQRNVHKSWMKDMKVVKVLGQHKFLKDESV